MSEYIELNSAVCIADYAADEHPYEKDTAKPETFSEYNQGWNDACDYIRDKLETEPAADVAPVVHGHRVDDGGFYARCSQCDGVLPLCANYCPNCGAKMDGGD